MLYGYAPVRVAFVLWIMNLWLTFFSPALNSPWRGPPLGMRRAQLLLTWIYHSLLEWSVVLTIKLVRR